ncbi:hypothetical protein O6H91_23G011900 [Diphasiastrum complanatum]|uniref:Uncharacterized protein n=1 Tax=Diphasiastrum complanatum TaxID=34168 RepID=A0ACC2A850_DIPCM|nr:hypothetical protein O6H91_23G011900 [Diphasiastrum complanatum]
MLMQVGGEGSRPTFFEMAAAQHLPTSLRAALLYSLGVLAQRRPIVHKILDYSDETFALLMLILEGHNLRSTDASFAEALYGLRRRPVDFSVNDGSLLDAKMPKARQLALTKKQRALSLFFLVGLPYVKSKMQAVYNAQRGGLLQAALWVRGDEDESREENFEGEALVNSSGQTSVASGLMWQTLTRKLSALLAWCYPWVHATHEGLSFAYQLLYLLDATRFYSPALHLMGIHVCRASGQELMDTTKRIEERREYDYNRLRGSPSFQAFQRGALRSMYAVLDYAQTGLIAAVFLFKMVEWWYQSAEERVTSQTVYPPPPPPPAPKVADGGIPLPIDIRFCPLCAQTRTNPAMVSTSGYVFCYPCIFNYISQYGRCPVTLIPAKSNQIRRLYHDA